MIQSFQRFLEFDEPAGVVAGTVPMWSWPVPLIGGGTMLTLLYRPLPAPGSGRALPTTRILHVSDNGDTSLWQPGEGHRAGVIFYANEHGGLMGLDLADPRKVYACRVDGEHLWTLGTTLRLDTLIAPTHFFQIGKRIYWTTGKGEQMSADVSSTAPTDIRLDAPPTRPRAEIHHPHTHLIGRSLYVLEFDPMPRMCRYEVE